MPAFVLRIASRAQFGRAHDDESDESRSRRSLVTVARGRRLRGVARIRTWNEIVDALYPPLCFVCGRVAVPDELGPAACAEHVLPNGPGGARCRKCAAPLGSGLEAQSACGACALTPPGIERLIVLADYRAQPTVRDWILALKHGARRDLAAPLGRALAREARGELEPGDVLVPVPLHPWRRLERGYDQAALLAESIAEEVSLPLRRALRRTRPTVVQGGVGAVSRSANVRGAFGPRMSALEAAARVLGALLPRRLRQRLTPVLRSRAGLDEFARVWLVDDVCTSGSTLRECARAVRRLGVRRVAALAIARASRGPPSARAGDDAWDDGPR